MSVPGKMLTRESADTYITSLATKKTVDERLREMKNKKSEAESESEEEVKEQPTPEENGVKEAEPEPEPEPKHEENEEKEEVESEEEFNEEPEQTADPDYCKEKKDCIIIWYVCNKHNHQKNTHRSLA